jgi:hypothetical protein
LLITSAGRDSSASKMSKARVLTSAGTPSLVSSLSLTTKRNGPKDMISLFCAAGVVTGVAFFYSALSSVVFSLKNRLRSLTDRDQCGQSIWKQG